MGRGQAGRSQPPRSGDRAEPAGPGGARLCLCGCRGLGALAGFWEPWAPRAEPPFPLGVVVGGSSRYRQQL